MYTSIYFLEMRSLIKEETQIERGKLITTLVEIGKEYRLYFEMKPKSFPNIFTSVIYLTTDTGVRFIALYRGIGFFRFFRNFGSGERFHQFVSNLIKVDEWVSFEFSQVYSGKKCIYTVRYNSTIIIEEINQSPRIFRNVKVNVSSDEYAAQPGLIRHLRFTNMH